MSGVRSEENSNRKKYKATKTNYKKQSPSSPHLPSLSFPFFSPNRILLQRLSSGNGRLLLFFKETSFKRNARVLLSSAFTAGLLVELNLNTSTPDTFRPPPAPLPYDVVLGCPQSPDSESVREIISRSSFETLATCEDLEELDCRTHASSFLFSPRKSDVTKLHEPVASATEEDACPICLEEYDLENPKHITKCKHHFHLSCILEWMERSDICPICDQLTACQL
ncbi:probable E3 ubiquitin-protein ligase RHB1A isoform X2 [Populus alba]|uniref:probable E3 ubiquitin-protein ligase RHB1A isoform X2 n=1 Tax=Populus alba TaxID=43335 RepID=UPI00158C95C2|nr:probable E3 ubiquitin-protein ligase RHB1A isoform X2 [Populus alba]